MEDKYLSTFESRKRLVRFIIIKSVIDQIENVASFLNGESNAS